MALKSLFIGIDQHSDSRIHELTGAKRDATALWALFRDSIEGIEDCRLLDLSATANNIRTGLDTTLGAATSTDTVVVYFAGHGTSTHELVPFDADLDAVPQTTIPMRELADRLRSTEAKASLIILDCCFSGAAPARVIEGLPVSRDVGSTVTDLGGNGRIVLAAAKDNEEALELGQHGLFTSALLEVLIAGGSWTDINALMVEVARRVRAEATRMGRNQTPVWSGLVEGGLELPPLTPGTTYTAEFPDTTRLTVGESLHDLAHFGVPDPILAAWTTRFSKLNEMQLCAVNEYRLLDGESLLVIAPTTSGKTFVGELAAADAIAGGRKAVFLLPFKALTNEKYEEFQELYGHKLGLRVLRCTGDYADDTDAFARGRYDLALLTYEMFLGISVSTPTSLAKVGLVVLDEAQFITDPTRGISVELLLTNLVAVREQGIQPQIVALSAVIGDVNHFDEWIGCRTIYTDQRPVPLLEGVLDRDGVFQFLAPDGRELVEQLLRPHEITQRRNKPSSQDVIVPLAQKLVSEGEQVLVFRNTRGSATGCAKYLARELGLPAAGEILQDLPDQDPSSTSQDLRTALQGGTAFHTSDLTREERVLIERAFRNPDGPIRALSATSTVAAGVNTPASTVIIAEHFFYGDPPLDYTVAEYKNMAGRAGRLGLAEQGRSVLLAESPIQRSRFFGHYVRGTPEPIRSSFDPRELETWILRLLAQVPGVPLDSVASLLGSTYGGYLANRDSPDWQTNTRVQLEQLLGEMTSLGLIEEETGHVRLSLLGKACARSHLRLRSAMRLVELLRRHQQSPMTATMLLGYVHALPEFDEAYTPIFRKGTRESAWPQEVRRHYGPEVAAALQIGARTTTDYYARCKRVAVVRSWTSGDPIGEIERHFTVNPFHNVGAGDIRGFAELARFHLRAAFEIAEVVLAGVGPAGEAIETLLTQLEFGVPEEAIGLLELPIRVPRGAYLSLSRAGYRDAVSVLALPASTLSQLIGEPTAMALARARPEGE